MKSLQDLIIRKALNIIQSHSNSNMILVLRGVPNGIKNLLAPSFFLDLSTFELERGKDIFNKEWFGKAFLELNKNKSVHILSDCQFQHLGEYLDPTFFEDRILVLRDNLRIIFPLGENPFLPGEVDELTELRNEELPIHHTEQFHIGKEHYFIPREYHFDFKGINLYDSTLPVAQGKDAGLGLIDLNNDPYAIDIMIDDLITAKLTYPVLQVSVSPLNPSYPEIKRRLELLNFILSKCNVSIELVDDVVELQDFQASPELTELLLKYWGDGASFRTISVYKDPKISSESVEVSQGKVVQMIISEFENAKMGKPYRDLLLTAPTGAGKSLLFQLPAFHVSDRGDVTIVVSPLIALMEDQVEAIKRERGFDKVAYLNSSLSLIERERLIESCKEGEIDIIYLSPELLLSYDISFFIGDRNLGLMVIDEAHLITTWGRDFRVDYWFLGNHLRKIRKYNGQRFPMVAVTATAIIGGDNDMVFDTTTSLFMENPYKIIGSVKRTNIEFVINNYQQFQAAYEVQKLKQTANFIEGLISNTAFKTLVYAPYTTHVDRLIAELHIRKVDGVTSYHGGLNQDAKRFAYEEFKNGTKQAMISTKAFGMGVDIADIQVVYHHAPSGSLPDFVQEVGRLARIPGIQGYAALNYTEQDKWFTKALHGMSALKTYELQEVLKKINAIYKSKKKQNMLIAVDDFAHIFPLENGIDQKVLTSLMMIEKDYLAKNRFNVLVARPKKLFSKTYARVLKIQLPALLKKYKSAIEVVPYDVKTDWPYSIVYIDLGSIWEKMYSNQSFPMLKKKYYQNELFNDVADSVTPVLKLKYSTVIRKRQLIDNLNISLNKLTNAFTSLGSGFFTEEEFRAAVGKEFPQEEVSRKISGFILSNYAGRLLMGNRVEDNAFMARRRQANGNAYRFINALYEREFDNIVRKLSSTLNENSVETIKFITRTESNSLVYIRMGHFIEIFESGTFEMSGGDNPMIFVRVNDPKRIEKDSNSYYQNQILDKTLDRHYLSNKIFDHFFMHSFSNSERWDFIEDFFLGKNLDELVEKYPGGTAADEFDIVDFLSERKNSLYNGGVKKKGDNETSVLRFTPNPQQFYDARSLLTLEMNGIEKTMSISKWITEDPILLHKSVNDFGLRIEKQLYQILQSKIRGTQYWIDHMGLGLLIEFPGINGSVRAIVPYKDEPVKFYLWWLENQGSIKMSFKEKIELFSTVQQKAPNKLKSPHKELLKK